ncbi:MAG TPA: DsbA family protein, partial [Acidimicrobiales bacterium]|nr:DsbA family protein [Acidimicrobiales bacterium]
VCPFAHVSLHRLVDDRARAGAEDVVIRVRAWPLELVNGEPTEADHAASEIDDLRAQVAGDLFTGFERSAFPVGSIRALGLSVAAYDVGPEVGEAVSLAVRDALFEHGRPIGDPEVLAAVAAEHGVDLPEEEESRRRVEADLAEGRARQVEGSPHFFVGGASFFCPALDIEDQGDHLRISVEHQRNEDFLRRAFG